MEEEKEEKEETMTEPKQKEKIDEKIAKYGREEANRKGDVGRLISCSSEDYPKYVDREARQDLLEIRNQEENNKSIEVIKNQNEFYSEHKPSFIGKLNDEVLDEPEDLFTEDPRRKPTAERECSGERMLDGFTEDMREEMLNSGIITRYKSFKEESGVNLN